MSKIKRWEPRLLKSKSNLGSDQRGVTLVELVVSLVVISMISLAFFNLFTSLVKSSILIKRRSVALTLATNQVEYLKSLPYNSLAVAGGAIVATNPLPVTVNNTLDGVTYTTTTSIDYVDDAFDGCASYPTQALKQLYCRNYPAPSGAPATDLNPADYKILHVSVTDRSGLRLAEVDTQISARVAETASTTGALFVSVIDSTGNPISGATVTATNTTLTPGVNVSDSTDSNGTAIFYGLPPDTNAFDYTVSASLSSYSSLTTIIPNGTLQPNYSSQKVFTQASSFVTLTLKPQGFYSLAIEATDPAGSALPNVKVYAKGGYKRYTATTDTAYYYDNVSPTDVRPTTDASGLTGLTNLVPGNYIFCGDLGATSCSAGGTTYYLAAAVPYGGVNPFNPITVPTYSASSPPATTFLYNSNNYLQKVRLILTTNSAFPRINTLTPYDVSKTGGTINSFAFQINGVNLPCSSTAASCGTTVSIKQGANTFAASCTGTSGTQINCTVNLGSAATGATQLVLTANGNTLTVPTTPLLGGINVSP